MTKKLCRVMDKGTFLLSRRHFCNALHGFTSIKGSRRLRDHHATGALARQDSGQSAGTVFEILLRKGWGRHIVTAIFDAFFAFWRRRNDILHGRTDAPKQHDADVRERLSTLLSDFQLLPPDLKNFEKCTRLRTPTLGSSSVFYRGPSFCSKSAKSENATRGKRPFTD